MLLLLIVSVFLLEDLVVFVNYVADLPESGSNFESWNIA